MSDSVASEMYDLSQTVQYAYFVDLLNDICERTSLNTRQLDILIKLDFFSSFGNQRELLRITELFFEWFKKGKAKQIKRSVIDGTAFEKPVARYATGVTKSGSISKSYTLLDVMAICRECEDLIKSAHLEDLSIVVKAQNFADAMGYAGYVSGSEEDRAKLYVKAVFPVSRKDGKQFGYSVLTQSLGSGIETRFTVFNRVFDKEPIRVDEVVLCKNWSKERGYFMLNQYEHIYT